MRKRRRSWLLAVHRWLFYFAVAVVVGSALSRIDDAPPRVVDARRQSSQDAKNAARDGPADDERAPPFVAFAGCP